MGRKKIDIRPLNDERNRNVTFLKRKAGLMKKAWELSVLCAADVSILIFSPSGKPYEFSSKELDSEIDRYLDYEGLIERRRAPEFAALALAWEDDDEDEDEMGVRRGSPSRLPSGVAGAPAKSLKGKEIFKARMTSRAELSGSTTESMSKGKGKVTGEEEAADDKRRAIDAASDRVTGDGESFGLERVIDEKPVIETSESTQIGQGDRDRRNSRGPQTASSSSSELAGLDYALNLHNMSQPTRSPHSSHPTQSAMSPPYLYTNTQYPRRSFPYTQPLPHTYPQAPNPIPYQPSVYIPRPTYNSYNHFPTASTPLSQPLLPNPVEWDPNLLSGYAEFQLQQNHHRQQIALLERQRQQLAELGIPVEDKSLLDQLLGVNTGNGETSTAHTENFEWPEVGQWLGQAQELAQAKSQSSIGISHHQPYGRMSGKQSEGDGTVWSVAEDGPFPSPASAVGLPRRDKREKDREKGEEEREDKRNRTS